MVDLSRFREIWFYDTEFVPAAGEKPVPVAVCGKELRSGRSVVLFGDELPAAPPYPLDDDVLMVCFCAAAEGETFLAAGWPLPPNVLDLRVEHICQTIRADKRVGGQPRKPPPRSLIDVLRSYCIPDGDAAAKDVIRARIVRGFPFTAVEREQILRYCLSDATALAPLLERLEARIGHLGQALRRGEYTMLTAEVTDRGIPFDPWAMQWLRQPEVQRACRYRLVSDQSLTHGLYEGATLKQARLAEFVLRHGLAWRRTPTGQLGVSNTDFETLAEDHPQFASVAEIKKTLGMLHEFRLASGSDNRCRTQIWAFSTITARMAPPGSSYPFTTAAWTRHLIAPEPGMSLAYLDFAAAEFGAMAGLSHCEAAMRDYRDGDPYLGLGAKAGLVSDAMTAEQRARLRISLKPATLGCQYGLQGRRAAATLGVSRARGQHFVDRHHREYAEYWNWSDNRIDRAFAEGMLETRDGWQCRVASYTSEFTARNWLIQANSASLFRSAGLMMRRLGLRIIAVVHDAVVIEAATDRIAHEAARATDCLERASRLFLHGLTLRVDVQYIHAGARFTDKRGAKVWGHVEQTLRELSAGDAAR